MENWMNLDDLDRSLLPLDNGETLAGDLLHAVDGFDPHWLDESCTMANACNHMWHT